MSDENNSRESGRGLPSWLQVDLLRRMGVEDVFLLHRAEATSTEEAREEAARPESEAEMASKPERLEEIADRIRQCSRCDLCRHCRQHVPGDGNPYAKVVFVGEAPGKEEDKQGIPFVGQAGKMLNNMIRAMTLKREEVYITNICKCRPPDNRTPTSTEMEACRPHLVQQLSVIEPEVIVTLGLPAAKGLLGVTDSMGRTRGKWYEYEGIKVAPTYHPAYLLRSPSQKDKVWQDLKMVLRHFRKEDVCL